MIKLNRHVARLSSSRPFLRLLFSLIPAFVVLNSLNASITGGPLRQTAVCTGVNDVGGRVYQDFNGNGVRDLSNPNDQGVGGVLVTAYNASGAPIASDTTEADGSYAMSIPNGTQVRIEFTGFPAGYHSGPFGSESATTVTFLQSPDCTVDLGINTSSAFCQSNPDLATNCYVFGNQTGIISPVLISFPYSAGGTSLPGIDNPTTHPVEATAGQVGTTWGLAYQRASNSLFAASFMKRHTGFGPGGPGAVYRVDRNSGTVSTFVDLNALFGVGTAGADPHGVPDYNRDRNSWDPVGKLSLGDIDISDDEQTLWVVNLNDRQVYEIPIGSPPTPPAASQIISHPFQATGGDLSDLPGLTDCPDPNADIRPFATGFHNGRLFVGMVCSAESTIPPGFTGGEILPANAPGDPTELRAYVYSFDPATDAFAQVLNFPLNYPRACAVNYLGTCNAAEWLPWVPVFTVIDTAFTSMINNEKIYPQPWLTDIAFDGEDMILGFRDRFADQMGFRKLSTDPVSPTLYSGDAAGDVLRACWNGSSWVIENNAACGGGSATNPNTGTGPGTPGGEYYFEENYPLHDETSLGGLVQVPGHADVVQTIYDPIYDVNEFFDGGVWWSGNATGTRTKTHRIFNTDTSDPFTFGKAGGLGDLEAMCNIEPIEIGNRVWRDKTDTTRNGIQDATSVISQEFAIPGVTVHLYLGGTLVATDTTDANGEYIFSNANVPGGVQPFTTYVVRLDNPADYALGGPLQGLTLTLANVGGNDAIDSDGVIGSNGLPEAVAQTQANRNNDHTYDFGFHNIAPTAVELLYFRVESVNGAQVGLAWATAAEIDNFGFNLYRAPANDLNRAALIHFEPSSIKGSGGGASYTHIDTVPANGIWWYWLADVDTQGHETRHGPALAATGPGAISPAHIYLPVLIRR